MEAQVASNDCDFCDINKRKASFYCDECEKFLCVECKRNIHDRVPIIQDHIVVDTKKTGGRVIKRKPVCLSHKQTFLYYCSKCECLTCKECMTSSHNGHTTETIKKIVDVNRVNAKEIHEKLKAKVEIVQRTLEAIKTNQMHQITSDFDSYVQKVEKSCLDMYGMIEQSKRIHMTAASDFQTIEKEDLDRKRVFFQRQYDESSGIILQIDNLLQESQDVTFFTGWKRLQTDVQNMIEIDQILQNPRRIESLNEDDFMKAVMGVIDKRLKRSVFKEKETEIELLTNANKEKETLACELKMDNNYLNKELRLKQAEIARLSTQRWRSLTKDKIFHFQYCAAIDIGSTHSGVAYCSKMDYVNNPPLIFTNTWRQGLPFKSPTAVLLDSSQEFVAFGLEAERKYSELVADNEHEDYYYFHRFKMLIDNSRVTTETMIKDEAGKEMEALMVFHLTIKYLKDLLNTEISKRVKEEYIQEICVVYVLTVPARWDYSAVELIRVAALEAGIGSRQLAIISEPEAASMCCRIVNSPLHDTQQKNSFETQFKSGKMFMMIDLGGESADITVHQRNIYNGFLREVIPPSGGPWGGKSIDDRFYIFLTEIVGADVMAELKKTELLDFNYLFEQFESKKRLIRVNQQNKIVVTIPVSLIDLVRRQRRKMETAIEQSTFRDSVTYSKQKLHISPDTFRDLFKPTIEALVEHLHATLRDAQLHDLKTIVMVGGFSKCELVQHKVEERFGKNNTIIIPEEGDMAVLRGAVLWSFSLDLEWERITWGK